MLYLKVANSATNNYRSRQSLYDFIQLSLIKTTKELKRLLNNKCDLSNALLHFKKQNNCLDCKAFLNLEIVGHRSSSEYYSIYDKNWRFATWDC